jgi:hypothetical protein
MSHFDASGKARQRGGIAERRGTCRSSFVFSLDMQVIACLHSRYAGIYLHLKL